ncbi:MAG: lytic transglycosylase domain-containing protein [Candidatus Aminicenantes bacterium]|nr:MAG: lytic transglycosylase domain-containing protein [Candidatus Aminicenantes bacterium]
MNKKIIILCIGCICLFVISMALFINYYCQYHDLKRIVESKLTEEHKKKDLYEQIILKYENMDFKIFAFEKKYAEFAKIVNKAFEEAKKNKLSPYTVLSVIQVESDFDPNAKSPVADGLMQINLDAWKNYFKIDEKKIYEIDYNITIGCRILRHYLDVSNGDLSRALYLYNNGYGFHNEKYVPKVQNNIFSKTNK